MISAAAQNGMMQLVELQTLFRCSPEEDENIPYPQPSFENQKSIHTGIWSERMWRNGTLVTQSHGAASDSDVMKSSRPPGS